MTEMTNESSGVLSLKFLTSRWGNKAKKAAHEACNGDCSTEKENVDPEPRAEHEVKKGSTSMKSSRAGSKASLLQSMCLNEAEEEAEEVVEAEPKATVAVAATTDSETEAELASATTSDSNLVSTEVSSWFVGGLDKYLTEQIFKEYFNQFAGLISVKIPREYNTGEPLGHGYVNYDSSAHGETAVESLNYTKLLGSEIRIMPSLRDKQKREKMGTNVFLCKISPHWNTRLVYDKYKLYGKILSCKYIPERGQAFVLYERREDALSMVTHINGTIVDGRQVYAGIHLSRQEREAQCVAATTASTATGTATPMESTGTSTTMVAARTLSAATSHSSNMLPRPATSTKYSLFIRNLPLSADSVLVGSLVAPYGEIKSITTRPIVHRDGSWALVIMTNQVSVDQAVQGLNKMLIEGHQLFATRAIPRENKSYAQPRKEVERGPKSSRKLKVLVSGLRKEVSKEQVAGWCSSLNSVEEIELVDNEMYGSYGYVAMSDSEEADMLIRKLKALDVSCYKLSIEASEKREEETDDIESLEVATSPYSAVLSPLEPVKMLSLMEFNREVSEQASATKEKKREKQQQQQQQQQQQRNKVAETPDKEEMRRAIDETIWDTAVRMFGSMVNPQESLSAAKVHSLTEHMVKFFWGGSPEALYRFLMANQNSAVGQWGATPIHPVIRYQVQESAKYLGVIPKPRKGGQRRQRRRRRQRRGRK